MMTTPAVFNKLVKMNTALWNQIDYTQNLTEAMMQEAFYSPRMCPQSDGTYRCDRPGSHTGKHVALSMSWVVAFIWD